MKVTLEQIRREYFDNLQEKQRRTVDKELRRTGKVRRNFSKAQLKTYRRLIKDQQ